MNKVFASLTIIILGACAGGKKDSLSKPYKFNRAALDTMVEHKKALYTNIKRSDGSLGEEKYFLADTCQYTLSYDAQSVLKAVTKFDEHGQKVWQEGYYPSGQRKSHFNLKTNQIDGRVYNSFDGFYEEYFENGNVKTRGVYKMDKQMWELKYDKDGQPGDTTFFDYSTHKK